MRIRTAVVAVAITGTAVLGAAGQASAMGGGYGGNNGPGTPRGHFQLLDAGDIEDMASSLDPADSHLNQVLGALG